MWLIGGVGDGVDLQVVDIYWPRSKCSRKLENLGG